jgi:flagellar basal-body rod protein FlgG
MGGIVMLRSMSCAASGMRSHQQSIDVTANNIANVNTTAFKQKTALFSDLVYQSIERRGNAVAPADAGQAPVVAGTGMRVAAVRSDMRPGTMIFTGRSLDLAITGDGFFRVRLPGGHEAYTRDGNFRLDGAGNVVNGRGFRVIFPALPADVKDVLVAPSGEVTVKTAAAETAAGKLELAYFNNPQGLLQLGDNLLLPTEAAGTVTVSPVGNGTEIRQGYLENANVDLAGEMVRLITGQRAFTLSARALRTADEMWASANQLRRY